MSGNHTNLTVVTVTMVSEETEQNKVMQIHGHFQVYLDIPLGKECSLLPLHSISRGSQN